MGNPFVHIELAADDLDAAKEFYGSVFDWKLQDSDMGGGMTYTMLSVGKGTGGGMMKKHGPQPTAWLPYVEVADVNASLAKARSAGGQVVVERMEIGQGMGAFGVIVDPQGASLGLWEAAKKAAPAKRSAAKTTLGSPRRGKKPAAKKKAAKPAKKKKGKR